MLHSNPVVPFLTTLPSLLAESTEMLRSRQISKVAPPPSFCIQSQRNHYFGRSELRSGGGVKSETADNGRPLAVPQPSPQPSPAVPSRPPAVPWPPPAAPGRLHGCWPPLAFPRPSRNIGYVNFFKGVFSENTLYTFSRECLFSRNTLSREYIVSI